MVCGWCSSTNPHTRQLLASAAFRSEEKPLVHIRNRCGDIGSPCLKPYSGLISSVSNPFNFTLYLFQKKIHSIGDKSHTFHHSTKTLLFGNMISVRIHFNLFDRTFDAILYTIVQRLIDLRSLSLSRFLSFGISSTTVSFTHEAFHPLQEILDLRGVMTALGFSFKKKIFSHRSRKPPNPRPHPDAVVSVAL